MACASSRTLILKTRRGGVLYTLASNIAVFATGNYDAGMKTKNIRIGLAVPRGYTFDRDILRGIARYAQSKPEWLFASVDPERQPLHTLGHLRPDGLIASVSTRSIARTLSAGRRPIVNVAATLMKLRMPTVRVDNTRVGELAAAHFLERGLRHFAFVGPQSQLFSVERYAAFSRALDRKRHVTMSYFTPAEIPFDPLGQRWDLDQGVQGWLRNLPKPVGLFSPGDEWGIQVCEACRQLGLRVPEDVAVLGVDNDDLNCELSRPRLSSVMLPAERIGYEAAALLDRLLAGGKRPRTQILLPPLGVATRRSTEVLAIDDREVVKAVRFIREHVHLPLRVTDVAREVAVGRRTLERRCQAALGRSLGEEIRRVHLERARYLLVSTDLPMKTVATQAGFSGLRHMGDVFRQQLGSPPTAYRSQHRMNR